MSFYLPATYYDPPEYDEDERDQCETCSGTGSVTTEVPDDPDDCPDCDGSGLEPAPEAWEPDPDEAWKERHGF